MMMVLERIVGVICFIRTCAKSVKILHLRLEGVLLYPQLLLNFFTLLETTTNKLIILFLVIITLFPRKITPFTRK